MKAGFIDWTEDSLNLYFFKTQGNRYILTDRQSVSTGEQLGPEALRSLNTGGIDNFYLSVPPDLLTLREQRFPFSGEDKIRDTISYELQGILLKDIGEYSIDHIVIDSADSGSTVLAVCLEKTKLREILDLFSSAGIDPKVITSLDLGMAGGRTEAFLEGTESDTAIRASAAGKEMSDPSINLRRDELVYTGDVERLMKSVRFTASLALVFLILLGSAGAVKLSKASKEHEALTRQLQAIYMNIFPEDKKIVDVERQFKGNLNSLKKKKAQLGGVPVLDILNGIAAHKNGSYTLHEFSADGDILVIKGTAGTFKDVEALKNSLSPLFNDVKVADSGASVDKKINFTIVMKEKSV